MVASPIHVGERIRESSRLELEAVDVEQKRADAEIKALKDLDTLFPNLCYS